MVKSYPSIVRIGDRYYYNNDPNTHNICIVTNIFYDTIKSKNIFDTIAKQNGYYPGSTRYAHLVSQNKYTRGKKPETYVVDLDKVIHWRKIYN